MGVEALKELVIFAYDLVCDKLNYSTLRFLLFSISINLIRLRQNHRIFIESNAVDIVYQEFLKLPQQAERMREIAQQLGFELNLKNIKQLFVAYAKEALSSPVEEEMINETAEEVVRQSTEHLARIIHYLSEKYRVPIEDAVGLAGYLHNTANLFKWETETFNILYPYIPNFIERTQYYIGDFVTDARQLVHEYIEAMKLDSSEIMHNVLVYELITHWPHLIKYLFTDQIRHIHCAVISDNNIDHAAFMVDVLNINKRPYVHYHVYTGQDIDPLTLDSSDYDVIITTFPIPPLQYKPVCSIHRFPTEKDFQLIDQTIYSLVNIK
ncbi:hypothetical protein CYJ57_05510 [Falseniella ignava]|uniref:M protein trans-acting positive regulator (MGA) PRD domain-containing protein n=1 Tax=Falseniella ignava TaxID=137730 RepID=A0A2I1JZ38_9LACT|nr:M protein trans-acting positive regulator PRD domain-containing protein [Falseniella ignava]PKY88582.1 hypothetical protein CYJ57_05510 [Falseniella ignava]